MKQLLKPKVLIPLVLGISILAALLAFGDIRKVIAAMVSFNRVFLIWILLLFVGYEAVRGWQWVYLLDKLKVKTSRRAEVFAFLMSEMAKSIPIGNYFQNYLLSRSEGADIGRTSAATTAMVLGEVAVSLTGIVVLGLGMWTSYLRIVIVGGLIAFGLSVWLFTKLGLQARAPRWVREHRATQKALAELKQFRQGAIDLLHWRILVAIYLNSALYLIFGGAALYFTARGVGATISFSDALAVYFFGLAVSLIFPLPVDFGVAEISGTGAFLLVGVEKAAAVSAMLIYRVVSIGSAIVIALAACVIMRDELRKALRERPRKGQRHVSGEEERVSQRTERETSPRV